jgi:acylphosphatase
VTVVRHAVVRGRVQGVGYRAWVEQNALRLGLEGWVRNRHDGTVEAVFSGTENAVAEMIEACRHGPRGAAVAAVDVGEGGAELLAARRTGERFSIVRTA